MTNAKARTAGAALLALAIAAAAILSNTPGDQPATPTQLGLLFVLSVGGWVGIALAVMGRALIERRRL